MNIFLEHPIDVTPLATVYPTVMESKKDQTSHATGSKRTSAGKSSNPTLDKIKEDGRDVGRAIRNLFYRVLNEDFPVAGISRPVSHIAPPLMMLL